MKTGYDSSYSLEDASYLSDVLPPDFGALNKVLNAPQVVKYSNIGK